MYPQSDASIADVRFQETAIGPSTVPLRVERLADENECLRLRGAWNGLAGEVPFRRWEWLMTWWKYYGAPHELFVLLVTDADGSVRGVAPWYLDVQNGRTIRFLGDGKVCTDHLTILSVASHGPAVVQAIASWLHAADEPHHCDRWNAMDLQSVLRGDARMDDLMERMRRLRHPVDARATDSCYVTELPASVEEYIQSRGKTNRLTMRRIQRKLASGAQFCRHLSAPEDVRDEDWELFKDLHGLRRATLKEEGCFQFPPFGEFLREATTQLMAAGQCSLLFCYDGQTPMAALHLLHSAATTYAYQTGMDPGVQEKRPGYVAFATALWWTIERGAREFDFLRGDEAYKRSWRAVPHAAVNVRISSRHLSARLRHQWSVGQLTIKDCWQRTRRYQ